MKLVPFGCCARHQNTGMSAGVHTVRSSLAVGPGCYQDCGAFCSDFYRVALRQGVSERIP